jgi:glutathione S-transferase
LLLRGRYKVNAPAMTGLAGFENGQQIFLNTLERLVPFLAALWLCAVSFSVLAAEILGVIWIVGRVLYAVSYTRDPGKRAPGFTIAFLATVLLMVGAAVGAVRIWLI